jgi:hypothetical protein
LGNETFLFYGNDCGNQAGEYYSPLRKIKNAADRHCYLLIKAALALLLFRLFIRALSLNLQVPPLKRVKLVPQQRQESNYEGRNSTVSSSPRARSST